MRRGVMQRRLIPRAKKLEIVCPAYTPVGLAAAMVARAGRMRAKLLAGMHSIAAPTIFIAAKVATWQVFATGIERVVRQWHF